MRKVHHLPAWAGNGAEWLLALEEMIGAERFAVVVPCDETTLLPLSLHRQQFEKSTTLAIPGDEAVGVLFDKLATRDVAARLGIPVAPGRLLRAEDTPPAIAGEFGFPLVLKPSSSYRIKNLHSRGKAQVIRSAEELTASLPRYPANESLIEGFFPGRGVGVSVLAKGGQLFQCFQHARVREVDGASFYRISAELHPGMVAACEGIARAVAFSGIAMFEFKVAADGAVGIAAATGRSRSGFPVPLGPAAPRWQRLPERRLSDWSLWPKLADGPVRDHCCVRRSSTWQQAPVLRRTAALGTQADGDRTRSERRMGQRRPGPAFAELSLMSRRVAARVLRDLPGGARRRMLKARHNVLKGWRRAGPIVFVCKGNICRSPFAEVALRRRLSSPVRIASAGTLPLPGRPSPPEAVEAAATRGFDLRTHRSRLLTGGDVTAAALLLVFDDSNVDDLERFFPATDAPVVRLGDLVGLGGIVDPVDGDLAVFERTYDDIERAVAELARLTAADGAAQ